MSASNVTIRFKVEYGDLRRLVKRLRRLVWRRFAPRLYYRQRVLALRRRARRMAA